MSDILVSLYRILPNPWQTRQDRAGDDAHVQELAADIKQRGLLQVPLGRLVLGRDDPQPYNCPLPDSGNLATTAIEQEGCFVQLACGHNRLAAYKLLDLQSPNDGWRTMPVRIAALDDQAMALAAWSENAQRKDLSPWEAALALQRLITDFGWTQDQVAAHVGLNRATVANKLRLLRLPEDLQKKLHSGDLSERQALALLPVYELPEKAQQGLERQAHSWSVTRLTEVLQHPDKKSSGDVRGIIRDAVDAITKPLANNTATHVHGRPQFPVDVALAGVAAPACLECPNRLQESRCCDLECWAAKQAAFERAELAFACAATGLPQALTADLRSHPWEAKKHFWRDNRAGLERALATHCPNLHLYYEPDAPNDSDIRVPDYPRAAYVCVRNDKSTTCDCAEPNEVQRRADEKDAQQQAAKAAAQLHERAIRALARDLHYGVVAAWRCVLWALGKTRYQEMGGIGKLRNIEDIGTIHERLAQETIKAALLSAPLGHEAARLAQWQQELGWDRVVAPGKPDEATEGEEIR